MRMGRVHRRRFGTFGRPIRMRVAVDPTRP